jgi:hypothetical protein
MVPAGDSEVLLALKSGGDATRAADLEIGGICF